MTVGRDAPTGETDTPIAPIGRLGNACAAALAPLCETVTHDMRCIPSQDGRHYLMSRWRICQIGSATTSLMLLCSHANVTDPEPHSSHGQPSPGAPSAGARIAPTVFFLDCRPPERAHSPLASTEGPRFSALARLEGGHLFHMRSSSVMDQRTKTLARLTTRRPMSTDPATSCALDGPPHDDPQATRAGRCTRFWHDGPRT
jgi:hypothetical protein